MILQTFQLEFYKASLDADKASLDAREAALEEREKRLSTTGSSSSSSGINVPSNAVPLSAVDNTPSSSRESRELASLRDDVEEMREALWASRNIASSSERADPVIESLHADIESLRAALAASSSVQTTERVPQLTLNGPNSVRSLRNIEIIEQFCLRYPGRYRFDQFADQPTIDAMSSIMRTRTDVIFDRIHDRPQTEGDVQAWLTWPMSKILAAWRPCIAKHASASQALTFKELLKNHDVASDFSSSWSVGEAISRLRERARECTNPSEADQLDAISLILSKHQSLTTTDYDPNGLVFGALKKVRLQTIAQYDVTMSDIAGRLETASYIHQEMYTKPPRTLLIKDVDRPKPPPADHPKPPRINPKDKPYLITPSMYDKMNKI